MNFILLLAAVVVGTWNGNWFPSGRAEHRAHPDVEAFVYGHLHIARMNEKEGMPPIIFLGDWISLCTYAVLDAEGRFELKHYEE